MLGFIFSSHLISRNASFINLHLHNRLPLTHSIPNANPPSHHPIPLPSTSTTNLIYHNLKQDKSVPTPYLSARIPTQNRSTRTINLSTSIARLGLTGDPGTAGGTVVVSGHYR